MHSSNEDAVVAKIDKYLNLLKDEGTIEHALNRLKKIPMTVQLLKRTGAGKAVNKMRSHGEFGELAEMIVDAWKEAARNDETATLHSSQTQDASPSNSHRDRHEHRSEDRRRTSDSSGAGPSSSKKIKLEPVLSAFDAALSVGDKVKTERKKKMKPYDWARDAELDSNYRPLPVLNLSAKASIAALTNGPSNGTAPGGDLALDLIKQGKGRQIKVYAGRRKDGEKQEIPKLMDMCIRVLTNHINDIEYTGNIPFFLLKPVLEKCSVQQLLGIENRNPYLEEDTCELWEKLCLKHHPTGKSRCDETWKETFLRLEQENQNKLKMLSKRIASSGEKTEKQQRTACLVNEVKAPREVRRRQIKNGTYSTPKEMPSAHQVSQARKQIFNNGTKAALSSLPSDVRNLSSSLGSHSEKKKQPKKGALMLKTLKMLGQRRK